MLNAGNPRYQRMYFDAGTDDDDIDYIDDINDIDNTDYVVDNDNGCADDDDYANTDEARHRYWRLAEALDGQKSPSLVI